MMGAGKYARAFTELPLADALNPSAIHQNGLIRPVRFEVMTLLFCDSRGRVYRPKVSAPTLTGETRS